MACDFLFEEGMKLAGRKRIMTEDKMQQYLKEGRGQGEGADYIPWIKVAFKAGFREEKDETHQEVRASDHFSDRF